MAHIVPSNICSSFEPTGVIGSKIINQAEFLRVLHQVVATHDFTKDRIPGQGYLPLPAEVLPFVSSGVGRRVLDPAAYVLREYRGRVSAFLKREFAAPVTTCAAVVYTLEAYLSDPDVTPEEVERINNTGVDRVAFEPTYMLVTVLASSGEESKLSPHRFVANLAGGNKEAQVWTADEIRAKACEVMAYENAWMTVADPV